MKFVTKLTKNLGTTLGCLLAIFLFFFMFAISWICTCGVVYLITLCFGWTFSWAVSTGIWLILCLLMACFKNDSK